MNRDEWKFQYTGAVLRGAAAGKHKHHKSRVVFWQKRRAVVMKDIRSRGLSVHESQEELYGSASNMSNAAKRGNYRAQITVDQRLQRDLDECSSKIAMHESKSREYEGWCVVLKAHPKQVFDLHQDDHLYFFWR